MEHVRAFLSAVGGKWFLLPNFLSGVIALLTTFRDDLGVSWVPDLSWPLIAMLAAIPIVIWSIGALTHTNVKITRHLESLQSAWDRSGRNLVSIREAMDLIIKNLSNQWPADIDETEQRRRAAVKLREIGLENQIPIWGQECLDNPQSFHDHRVKIPPQFWEKNKIDFENVYARQSTQDNPILHTVEDPIYAYERELQKEYGDLRIDGKTLEAACPPANT